MSSGCKPAMNVPMPTTCNFQHLLMKEVMTVAKSIAKWTSNKFSSDHFERFVEITHSLKFNP
jgi:hypothetical protein